MNYIHKVQDILTFSLLKVNYFGLEFQDHSISIIILHNLFVSVFPEYLINGIEDLPLYTLTMQITFVKSIIITIIIHK